MAHLLMPCKKILLSVQMYLKRLKSERFCGIIYISISSMRKVLFVKNIDDLIELIMGDGAMKELSSKVYKDEPILKRASQLVQDVIPKQDTPTKLMEMRRMVYLPEAQWKSREWLFYKQGNFMAGFEDDFDSFVPFEKYYPTYADMTLSQQRTFFSWRTRVRCGEYPDISLSYIFVYCYEMINLIGVETPLDAYNNMKTILEKYEKRQPKLKTYIDRWLFDMVIYYDLDSSLLEETDSVIFDNALTVMKAPAEHTEEELFRAINMLSSYNAERSSFYKTCPEDFMKVTTGTYLALDAYYAANRQNSLFNKFFGNMAVSTYTMFAMSVFCHYRFTRHNVYDINSVRGFSLSNGIWYCSEYLGKPHSKKQLGDLLRAIDSIMREQCGFKKALKCPDITKQMYKVINEQIKILQERKKLEEAAKVEIDLSKLGSIRRAAAITRDKLIVEEETDDEPTTQPEPIVTAEEEHGDAVQNSTPLNDGEYAFMQALLYGGDCRKAAQKAGSMPSLLADSINEKLYDDFADTVLTFDGDTPVVIEDYEEELKGMILP